MSGESTDDTTDATGAGGGAADAPSIAGVPARGPAPAGAGPEGVPADREVADGEMADALRQPRRLADLFDESIPLPGGYSIGLDPLVGLLPVVGDLSASAVSVYIVMEAVYLGVPRETLARMLANVAVDTVVGGLPIVGDLFDAAFKANARNVALLEQRLVDPEGASADRRLLAAVGVVLALVVAATSVAIGAGVLWLVGELGLA